MNDVLSAMASSVAVAGFIAAAFSYIVLRPIYNVIADLKQAIAELRAEIRRSEAERRELDKRVVRVEESVKSAHHRIDNLANKPESNVYMKV